MAIDTAVDAAGVRALVEQLVRGFAADRVERQARDRLDPADLVALAAAGVQRAGLPATRGGLWVDLRTSARPICDIWRALARGDSSLALTTSMHPAVLSWWLTTPEVPEPDTAAWRSQCAAVADTVEAGAWWGTITSEPGSGGDVAATRATARWARGAGEVGGTAGDDGAGAPDPVGARAGAAGPPGSGWLLSGQKHFGSGTGVTSYVLTTAVPDGDEGPDWFYVPVEGNPLDGSAGVAIIAPWDGHGMVATQSHAVAFDDVPAVRVAWPGHLTDLQMAAGPFVATLFTAVVLGIVDEAMATARSQLASRAGSLRAYEQVEWARADLDAWTMVQAYEGALRAIESGRPALGEALRAKVACAELAESCLGRLCRVLGGGTFARRSPFGHWFEDVRALGFLRPPWGLAHDALILESLQSPAGGGDGSG
jgi:alkylation response protein AidB-like acyl-CoA dehydrogenase